MLIFVTGPCCSLPILCNGSSFAATAGSTAGTGFLVSGVGGSMVCPECQGHRRNDAIAATTFVEKRKISQGANVYEGGMGQIPAFSSQKLPLLLLVDEQLRHILRRERHIPSEKSNLQGPPK